MNKVPKYFDSSTFKDDRGWLRAYNSFNMQHIKRMYLISPASTDEIRAWQYHEKETKYFMPVSGKFLIKALRIQDPIMPECAAIFSEVIDAESGSILEIPPGYANGLRAVTEQAVLMVFSDKSLEDSQKDDYRWKPEKFNVNWEL